MQRVRIELREHQADPEPAISGWGALVAGENGLSVLTLDHEYPDRKPAIGWSLSCGLGVFSVVACEGKALTVHQWES